MKKLELAQMEQLNGGAADPCSGAGWWAVTIGSALASAAMGVVNIGLGVATSAALAAAHDDVCG